MSQNYLQPYYGFLDEVEALGPFDVNSCFQCRKCTNGCPVTFAMDLYPDEVIRLVILGQRDRVLQCRTIWVCASCETCTTRCPNSVKIAELMDCLKEMAIAEDIPSPQPQITKLHQTFLNNVKLQGRVFESSLLPIYMLRSGMLMQKWNEGTWFDEAILGWKMFYKNKMPIFPSGIKGKKEVREILKNQKSILDILKPIKK